MPFFIPLMIAAASAIQGEKARKDAKAAQERRDQLDERSLALTEAERKRQFELYGPLEEKLARELGSDQPSNWGLQASDIERNYADLGRRVNEGFTNSGLDNASGLQVAANTGLGLNKARDRSRAYMEALDKKRGERFSFLQRYNPAGLTQMVSGQLGNMAGRQAGDMDMYGRESDQAWAAAGSTLMNGLMMERMNKKNPPPPGTPSAPGAPNKPPRQRSFMDFMFGWGDEQ